MAKSTRKRPLQGGKDGAFKKMLLRKRGVTRAELLDYTEQVGTRWTAMSVPQQAEMAGLKLKKKKERGKPTIYFGALPKGKASKQASA